MIPRLLCVIAVNTGLRVPFGTRPLSKNSRLPMYYGPVSPSSDGNMGPYKELTREYHLNLTVVYLGWALVEAEVPPVGPAKCIRNQPVFLHSCTPQPWVSLCVSASINHLTGRTCIHRRVLGVSKCDLNRWPPQQNMASRLSKNSGATSIPSVCIAF